MNLEIEPSSMRSSGRCACCGKVRRTAWGFVYRDGGPRAAYFVEWTTGRRDCTARFDVVVGDWNDGTTEDDREAVSLEYRVADGARSFALAEVAGRPAAEIGRPRSGNDVRGTAVEDEVRAIAGAILDSDERVRELAA